jgi:hypothetical protein
MALSDKRQELTACYIAVALIFLPTFGIEGSGIFKNILAVIFGLACIVKLRNNFWSSAYLSVVLMNVSLFVLLLISFSSDYAAGNAALGDLPSALRPLMFLIIITAFTKIFSAEIKTVHILDKMMTVIFLSLVSLFILELVFPRFRNLLTILYGERNTDFSIHLLTSYYASYLIFFVFTYFLCIGKFKGDLLRALLSIPLLLNIILADSKPATILAFLILVLFLLPKKNWLKLCAILIGLVLLIDSAASTFGLIILLEWLVKQFDLYSLQSLLIIVQDSASAGTYSVRESQIIESFELSSLNGGFGVGLGRGMLLESWLSYFTFRYGIYGSIIYLFSWIWMTCLMLKRFVSVRRTGQIGPIYLYLCLWFGSQPILLMSGAMNESGETSIIYCMAIGLALSLIRAEEESLVSRAVTID